MTNSQRNPVFVVGAMRSGTTLLRLMMDHHPEICIFDEFEYAVRWMHAGAFPSMHDFYRHLELDRVFREHRLQIDKELTYEQLVKSFLDQGVSGSNKAIGGATVHSNFHFLPKIWKEARYIHLVRDPRDVSRSCIGMNWVGNVWYGADYWLGPIQRWKKLLSFVGDDRCLQVRFEDLIADPQSELTRVCEFLGLKYSPQMMTYPENSTYEIPDIHLTEQWKRKLSADEIWLVESKCHGWMEEFGYQTSSSCSHLPSRPRKLALNLQHRLIRIQTSVKKFGLPLWCSWQFAKRLPYCQLKRNILRRVDAVVQRGLK